MNSFWVEQYAKQRMSELTHEASGDQLVSASKASAQGRRQAVGALSRALIARLSAAAVRVRTATHPG